MTNPLSTHHQIFSLEDPRWRALVERDSGAAGLYAVRSTGVFCRFGCPSRRPTRANVVFFDNPSAAEAGGFRACRRCQPNRPNQPGWTGGSPLAQGVCRFLESQEGRVPTLRELAERFELSPSHLQRVFKRAVGVSPRAYADALRVTRLKEKLRNGHTVTRAMVETGYGSASRLYENVSLTLGMSPRAYRDKATGEAITYTTVRCPVGGVLLVAATGRGLCSVQMGEREKELVAAFKEEFEGAELTRGDSCFVKPLVAYLEGLDLLPPLPVDVQATAFQRRVWEAIRAIPAGETETYSELAARIGSPRATRAVASACARNPVALVIPCHRVVPKAGGGGYRWGPERKRKLLRLEQDRGSREPRSAGGATSGARRSPR